MENREIEPIAVIHTDFHDKFGIPRQSGRADDSEATVIFEPKFRDESYFREIMGFEYLWLIFDFSKAHREKFAPTVRPPRLGGNKRVGVFASRSPYRPNSLGLSSVKLIEVKHSSQYGTMLVVGGADLLDGTPIYDIKPYLPFSDSHPDAKAGYADTVLDHTVNVTYRCNTDFLTAQELSVLTQILREDPKPSYQNDASRIYKMNFSHYSVSFTTDKINLYVNEIKEQ